MPSTSNPSELRERCALALDQSEGKAAGLTAFVGFDGFVDEILHVVDKRTDASHYDRLPTIARLAERLSKAAGKSTNIELVPQRVKLGGNGPILANALAALGVKVSYLGTLGYPDLHPVFRPLAERAEVHSIAEPGHTDALEFDDGKLMLGKHASLKELNWENIQKRFGRDQFQSRINRARLAAFVNWTMLPHLSRVWEAVLEEICPHLDGTRRTLFFDLADPAKRTREDILHALKLIAAFTRHFDVILGLNEKESFELASALGIKVPEATPDGLAQLAKDLCGRIAIKTIVIHPVAWAMAIEEGAVETVQGPRIKEVKITTGGGDHFNAGFCLGKLLGLDLAACLQLSVATSGFYVSNARSPGPADLATFLRNWPEN